MRFGDYLVKAGGPKMSDVVVLKVNNLHDDIDRIFDRLNLSSLISPSDKVLIKPNLCGGNPRKQGTTTSTEVILHTVEKLKELTDDIIIGESDGIAFKADNAFKLKGLTELKREKIQLINLSKDKKEIVKLQGEEFKLPKTVLTSDYIISLPVMKTHYLVTVTLGIKNLFGIIPGPKLFYHSRLSDVIVPLVKFLEPKLIGSLIDGVYAMEGAGPTRGETFKFDTILGGRDIVATDAIGAYLMGFDPRNIEHIVRCGQAGVGAYDINKINIIGESLNTIRRTFRLEPLPLNIRIKEKIATYLYLLSPDIALKFLKK